MLINNCEIIEDGYKYMETVFPKLNDIKIKAEKGTKGLQVKKDKDTFVITFSRKVEFFRGLSYVMNDKSDINEFSRFENTYVMLDVSRCRVANDNGVKKMLEYCALMGLTGFMLYTEDLYEVEGEEYFGLNRGKYTYEDLKSYDDFAYMLGVEMIPCIQTLGHMESFLSWEANGKYADTERILMADDEETMKFIEKMIVSASRPYRSKKIHLGMDEAFNLGLGAHLFKFGYEDKHDIFVRHLNRVYEITQKYGLKPMIWSDEFIRSATGVNDYYADAPFIHDVTNSIPEGVDLAYWDYCNFRESVYERCINQHKQLGRNVIYCGSSYTHGHILLSFPLAFSGLSKGIRASKKCGLRDVMLTIWESHNTDSISFSLPAMVYMAEATYNDNVTDEIYNERFFQCTGCSAQAMYALGKADIIGLPEFLNTKNMIAECDAHESDMVSSNPLFSNISHYLVYQDVLLGKCDYYARKLESVEPFEKIIEEIKSYDYGKLSYLKETTLLFLDILVLKAKLGVDLTDAYKSNDREKLKEIANNILPELIKRVNKYRVVERKISLKLYKSFGSETRDRDYGEMTARLEYAKMLIDMYLNGEIDKIEELEEKRLPPRADGAPEEGLTRALCIHQMK